MFRATTTTTTTKRILSQQLKRVGTSRSKRLPPPPSFRTTSRRFFPATSSVVADLVPSASSFSTSSRSFHSVAAAAASKHQLFNIRGTTCNNTFCICQPTTIPSTITTMKRCVTSDQAKLLFLGFLRTVSALATTTEARVSANGVTGGGASLSTSAAAAACTAATTMTSEAAAAASSRIHHPQPQQPLLTLRLARRSDVPSIQQCNLATLPENYNQQFYSNHLRQWPDLAFVAIETIVPENDSESENNNHHNNKQQRHSPLSYLSPFHIGSYSSSSFSSSSPEYDHHNNHHLNQNQQQPEEKVVAYVLGKVEERTRLIEDSDDNENYTDDDSLLYLDNDSKNALRKFQVLHRQKRYHTEALGHVTSLAVLEPYRRRGLAQELMKQLHFHLVARYPGISTVGLHVRQSNQAAERLYEAFGYFCDEQIPNYYQDGEDGCYMKKLLEPMEYYQKRNSNSNNNNNNSGGGFFGSLRRSPPWETGPLDLRLPRSVGQLPEQQQQQQQQEEAEDTPELLTGTM